MTDIIRAEHINLSRQRLRELPKPTQPFDPNYDYGPRKILDDEEEDKYKSNNSNDVTAGMSISLFLVIMIPLVWGSLVVGASIDR